MRTVVKINTKQLGRGILVSLVMALITACGSLVPVLTPPEITVAKFQVVDVQLLEQQYALTLRVQNPNNFPLPIQGLSYKLSIQGVPFAHGVSRQSVWIDAYGEALIEVSLVSGTLNMIRQMSALQTNKGQPIEYLLTGQIGLEDRLTSIPFEKRGALNLDAFPKSSPH